MDSNKIKIWGIDDVYLSNNVAIVGNSDILLKNEYGELIDSFTDVIRFNYVDTRNEQLKKYSGKKTTLRMIFAGYAKNIEDDKSFPIKILSKSYEKNDFQNFLEFIVNDSHIVAYNGFNKIIDYFNQPAIIRSLSVSIGCENINILLNKIGVVEKFDNYGSATTGFVAIILCIISGILPHVFGFDNEIKELHGHYDDDIIFLTKKVSYHQIHKEKIILNELIEKKLIVYY
jgi:hypothetical protein